MAAGVRRDRLDAARHHDLGTEAQRLLARPRRQVVARDAARKPEVVLDPRRRAGLAARRLALDQQRAQALGRAVHARPRGRSDRRPRSRRRTSRAAARPGCRRLRPAAPAEGCCRMRPSGSSTTAQVCAAATASVELGARGDPRLVRVGPLERHLVAREEIAQAVAVGIVRATDHDRHERRGRRRPTRGPRCGSGSPPRCARAAAPTRAPAARTAAGRTAPRAAAWSPARRRRTACRARSAARRGARRAPRARPGGAARRRSASSGRTRRTAARRRRAPRPPGRATGPRRSARRRRGRRRVAATRRRRPSNTGNRRSSPNSIMPPR